MSAGRDRGLARAWRWLDAVAAGALWTGVLLAFAVWEPAAWLVAGTVGVLVAGHVAIAAVAYRRVMRRPWPHVERVPFDDD